MLRKHGLSAAADSVAMTLRKKVRVMNSRAFKFHLIQCFFVLVLGVLFLRERLFCGNWRPFKENTLLIGQKSSQEPLV